jgi:hypothetical protein
MVEERGMIVQLWKNGLRVRLSGRFVNDLELLILSILVLNCIDGILTIVLLGTGKVVEMNPMMAYLLGYHPLLFMVCKQFLVSAGVLLLWRLREHVFSIFSLLGIFVVYYMILLHQIRLFHIGLI